MLKLIRHLTTLLLVFLFVSSPLLAQRRNASPKKPAAAASEPAPTFDELLATDSYKVYCEIRAVGGLVRSPAVNDLLEPLLKLGKPPKEFDSLVKWLNGHAEILAGSRMMVAAWPSRPKLPTFLIAIEFSSPEEARKFYPELRDFLPTILPTPTPTPSPLPPPTPVPAPKPAPVVSASPAEAGAPAAELVVVPATPQIIAAVAEKEPTPTATPNQPPYQMRQEGALVLISDTVFTFRNLRPRASKALEEDQNFMLARNRFASESVFLYVDLKSIENEEKAERQRWEEEARKREEAEAANPPKPEEIETVETFPEKTNVRPGEQSASLPPPEVPVDVEPMPEEIPADTQASGVATLEGEPQRGTDEAGPMFFSLYSGLFGGESKWPEAVGVGLVFENDAYVVRALILNSVENRGNAIPFVPQFVSGPPLVPESPNVFPADTNLFVSFSLDYPQIYEGMLKAMVNAEALSRKNSGGAPNEGPPPQSPFAVYEKKLGIKIKDDLLPLLGNEMALALAKKPAKASTEAKTNTSPGVPTTSAMVNTDQKDPKPADPKLADPAPVFAIAVKDREAVARLIPKLIEGFGLKGANLLAQTEKRDGTELTSYAGVFSYAFVGDFLIVSPDAAETRHVVDAYLSHQTLSSDNHFRNFTRWQPRQVLGQVYVGPDLMETYNPFGAVMGGPVDPKMNDFLSRLSPLIEPTTYVLSNDGSGPLHELHVPRNLLMWLLGAAYAGAEAATAQLEGMASQSLLRTVFSAEATFQATEGHGRYGTLDELVSANLVSKEGLQNRGYKIEVTASANKFEATAVPIEYGVTGTISYFIDESGVLRGGDHGGGPATVADQPVE